MAMKIKGIYKSFKFISQIFAVKEREMEIGHPTDVKHVAHIGWDIPSIPAPTWMNEFRTSPNLATSSSGNTGEPRCSNQDMKEPVRSKITSINSPCLDYYNQNHNNASKKSKSRKTESTSSTPRSSSSSSSSTRRSRAPKSKLTFSEATPTIQI